MYSTTRCPGLITRGKPLDGWSESADRQSGEQKIMTNPLTYLSLSHSHSVEVVFDDQCDVAWSLPKGVEPIPLFQTTSFNIDGDSLDLIGGVHGRTFHFQVLDKPV